MIAEEKDNELTWFTITDHRANITTNLFNRDMIGISVRQGKKRRVFERCSAYSYDDYDFMFNGIGSNGTITLKQ